MRINYYVFPKELTARQRYAAYEEIFGGNEDWNWRRVVANNTPDELVDKWYPSVIEACSVTTAKKLLRKFGGSAYTQHFERDGGLIGTTQIELKGNNSKFKYNHHL